jgi:hypothetical protein
MKVTLIGAKFFEGSIDGKTINSGKLYTICKLDDSRGNAKGSFSEEWKVTPELVKRIMHLPMPFDAVLETERVGNGRESREVVVDLRPVQIANPVEIAKPAKPAKPA